MQMNSGHAPASIEAVPANWQQKTLIELASGRKELFDDGDWIESEHITTMGIRLIQTGNIGIGVYVEKEAKKYIYEASFTSLRCKPLEQGDLLICRLADPAGRACVLPDIGESRVVTSVDVTIFRPPPEVADRVFLCNVFSTPNWFRAVSDRSGGTTHKRISRGALGRIAIALPPIEEQRAIAAALSDVDALLAGLDRLIAKKRDLKQAAMQQLLTGQVRLPGFQGEWAVKRLGEIGSTYGGLTGKSKADFGSGTAKYVTFMNVMSNTVIDHSMFEPVRVSPSENQNRVERGDLLFNGSSETPEEVAFCALVNADGQNVFLNSFCFGFRPYSDSEVDGLFLTYYIRSGEGREIMKSLAQGSTRYNLSKKALLEAAVRLPTMAEQSAIAGVLADIDAELKALQTRRDKTGALKQGMMQELLTGRTRLV